MPVSCSSNPAQSLSRHSSSASSAWRNCVSSPSMRASVRRAARRYNSSGSPATSNWLPSCVTRGCCNANSRQNASMVWMRNCEGSSSRFQPSARERASTRCATAVGSAFRSSSRMRLRISAAAALVKVMATISPGSFTNSSSARNRSVSNVVLPEPAGACTSTERAGSTARMRSAWSGGSGRAVSLIAGLLRIALVFAQPWRKILHAAQ